MYNTTVDIIRGGVALREALGAGTDGPCLISPEYLDLGIATEALIDLLEDDGVPHNILFLDPRVINGETPGELARMWYERRIAEGYVFAAGELDDNKLVLALGQGQTEDTLPYLVTQLRLGRSALVLRKGGFYIPQREAHDIYPSERMMDAPIALIGGEPVACEGASELEQYVLDAGESVGEVRQAFNRHGLERGVIHQDIGILIARISGKVADDGEKWTFQEICQREIARALLDGVDSGEGMTVSSATGTGKTRMQEDLVRIVTNAGYRHVIHVSHYLTHLQQTREAFQENFGVNDGIFANFCSLGHEPITNDTLAVFTTYDSLVNLLDQYKSEGVEPPLIIFDEAHNLLQRRAFLLSHPMVEKAVTTCWTATPGFLPDTLAKKGMPTASEFPLPDAIARRVLSPVQAVMSQFEPGEATEKDLRQLADDGGKVNENYIERLMRSEGYIDAVAKIALGKCAYVGYEGEGTLQEESPGQLEDSNVISHLEPTIIEAFDKDQAQEIYKRLGDLGKFAPGVFDQIRILNSDNTSAENQRILDEARAGGVNWIITVNMMVEAVDLPRFRKIIMRPRPCSAIGHDQALGRVLRAYPGKIACIYQLYDTPNPEEKGYRTVRLQLGVDTVHPGVTFYGDAAKYDEDVRSYRATGVAESRKKYRSHRRFNFLPDVRSQAKSQGSCDIDEITGLLTIANVLLKAERDEYLNIGVWKHVETERELKEFIESRMVIFTNPSEVYPEPISLRSVVKDDTYEYSIHAKRLGHLLGVSKAVVKRRFPGVDLVRLIRKCEIKLGIESLSQKTECARTLFEYVYKKIEEEEIVPGHTEWMHYVKLFGCSPLGLNLRIQELADQGDFPPEVNSLKALANYAAMWREVQLAKKVVPFELDLDTSKGFIATGAILRKLRDSFVQHAVNNIQGSYGERGFYFRPAKYHIRADAAIYGLDPKMVRRVMTSVRKYARTLQRGRKVFGVSTVKFFGMIVDEAEKRVEASGIVITQYPYTTLRSAYTFMMQRAQEFVDRGGSFCEGAVSTKNNNNLLIKIFGIRGGELKRLCREGWSKDSFKVSATPLLARIASRTDPEFKLSYDTYMRPGSINEVAQRIAEYILSNDPEFSETVYAKTISRYAPRPLSAKTVALGRPNPDGDDISHMLKTFCRNRGVTPGELVGLVNKCLHELRNHCGV